MDDTKLEDDQPQGATPEAEQESDIVKVDEAAEGDAKVDDVEPQSPAAKSEPSKATKGPIKLKVVLLEGKDLDLEEKVPLACRMDAKKQMG